MSPALAPIEAVQRKLRIRRRNKEEVMMVEFSPMEGNINLQPLRTSIPTYPSTQRISKSAYSPTRKRPSRTDQSILLDIISKPTPHETTEEPKESLNL